MADAARNIRQEEGAKSPAAGDAGQIITVVGPKEGRRRAWPAVRADRRQGRSSTITAEQLAAIKADPKLAIVAE